ncbi:hypothetical protein [Pseudonocardia thermophila]|uniref:hypothetical protein n=1 Tax=Pseudonocardia thermophila TaxID=1848 RepID=UPI001F42D6DF|nr:hypothetical protein [Pseudonocardia thermophila]
MLGQDVATEVLGHTPVVASVGDAALVRLGRAVAASSNRGAPLTWCSSTPWR